MSEQAIAIPGLWSEHWYRTMKTGYWICGHCGLTWPLMRVRIWNEDMTRYNWEDVDAYPEEGTPVLT